jgi:hypothetical protein
MELKNVSRLTEFYDYLQKNVSNNLTMIIGYNVFNPNDVKRILKYDIAMDEYSSTDKIEEYFKTPETNIQFIFNMDFNNFCVLSKGIITKFNNINKIKTIIFDSSTFKFLINIKMIALFYYLTLEDNGTIFIESNKEISNSILISNKIELNNIICRNNDKGFYYQTGILIPKNIEIENDKITKKGQIYFQNIEFFKLWFYGSYVELIDNCDNSYPVINENYPVLKYYKITKILSHNDILKYVSENIVLFNNGLNLRNNSIMKMK